MNPMSITIRAVLCGVAAFSVMSVTACSSDPPASEARSTGTITIPLQAEVGGTAYRLEAVFEISGAAGTMTLSTTAEQAVLTTTLPEGEYTALLTSFTLFRDDGTGTFEAVPATVESASQDFSIFAHTTTTITFQFITNGAIVPVGSGDVNITFGVTEVPPPACTPFVDRTQRTVQTSRFFLDFSNVLAQSPEDLDVLRWAGGSNLAQSFATDACTYDVVEHFGNSWAPPDPGSGGRVLVGAGSTGDWEQDGASIVIHSQTAGCAASLSVPVETRYRFREGLGADTIEVERSFDFGTRTFRDFRPFIPRLTVAFDRVLHPDATGTVLRTENVLACPYGCDTTDWDGSWFAYYASSGPLAGQGMIVRRAPSAMPASLWIDNDAGITDTNASGVIFVPSNTGFPARVTEHELLCFFDAQSFTPSQQAALALPPGCVFDLPCTGRGTFATNEQKLPLTNLGGEVFAGAVAVDEQRVLVSVGASTTPGSQQQRSVEVFVRSGTTWSSEAQLVASDQSFGDGFGGAVAVSNDIALVGAAAKAGVGAVYFYERQGSAWSEQQKIVPTEAVSGELFGSTLALDGTTAVVGSDGLARVFTYDGTAWSLQQKLPLPAQAFGNGFGRSALDGDTLVIGSLRDTVGANSEQGSAYVYERSGTTWTMTQRLVAADGQSNDHFANTVAISGDTIVVAVDSFFHPELSGSAYVFVKQGGTFVQQAKLLSPDGAPQDAFGLVVAVSGDLALISGSKHEHGGAGTDTGSAYLFHRTGTQWTPIQELMATDPTNNVGFGAPLALSQTHAAISAPPLPTGGAYVFDL